MKQFYILLKHSALTIFAFLFISVEVQAQMIVIPNQTANSMVDRLVGTGVTYTNPVLTCPSGASGKFDNAILTTLVMDSGVVLTSGSALNTNQNAGVFSSVSYGTVGGDANLQAAATGTIYDLCKLEFDFVPIGDTVKFFYRFGSEEYTNYTCSSFNDIFSFFISGPGYGVPTNVALIPGTNCPVSINTVNWSNANPCGTVVAPCAPPNNALYINNTFGASIVYDGLTQKIMARAAVTPCSTYHMKFAIADVYDGVLDSGVFLEAGSFVSEAATISNVTSSNNIPAATPFAIEGCNSATITLSRPAPKPYSQTIALTYAGTATNGVDFPVLPTSVVIPAFGVSTSFNISPIQDNIPEGIETVKVYVYGTLCGNIITDSVTINILEYPNFTVSNDDTICQGQTSVMTATPNPGNANLTFTWAPIAFVNPTFGNVVTATPNATTTYTVTSNYPGCPPHDSTITIFVEPTPTISLIASPILCNGNTNGSITASGIVNYSPVTFQLLPGGVTQIGSPTTFNNLGPGVYTVTVSSAIGCTQSASIIINNPPTLTWQNVTITNIPCGAVNTGQINAAVQGGTPTYSYLIMPGGFVNNTGIFTNLGVGNYAVIATDANGCSVITTLSITQPVGPTFTNIISTNPNCNNLNGSIIVTATGNGGLTYTLNPGNISNATGIFNPLVAGTYTIQVVDATSCTSTTVVNLVVPPLLTVTAVSNLIPCFGGNTSITVNVNGGTPAFQYSLNAGPSQLSNVFNNLNMGVYSISVTDANGCTGNTTISISQPTLLSITNITFANPTCVPGNDGSMTITASGGTLPYTYNIGGANQANNVFNNLGAGNYTITVTDANGCTATSTQTIAPPNSPTITAVVTTDVDCNGGNNGSITVTATGGLGTLNYNLQPVNQNNATGIFTNLAAGVYTMTVADANGCTISITATIIEPTILSWTATAATDVNCNGGNDGTLTATATGGTGMINYNLQPTNQTNNTGLFTNLTAGTYTVTATDANGCTLTTTLVINQSPALTWTQNTATNITCNGGNDGSITTTATGGTGIINYNLQPTNQTNNTGLFTNLAANTYTILATDANGCTISTTLTITEPTLLSITNITFTNPTCVPGNDGSMTITASGGTLAYTYNIGGANQASNVFANLGAGNYTITVTDANGCTATSTQTIAPPNSPTITAVLTTDVDCNGGNNGSITVTATGGLGALSYNLQPVNQNNATGIFTNLAAGVYTMTVADANGCTISSTATIIEPTILSWTATATTDVNCNGGNDGTLTATATGGTGMINYNLQPTNQTNNTGLFTNLTAGTYTVTATDANGCTLTTTLMINQSPALIWTQNTATNINCNGGIDGTITTTATGGTGIINYNLQPTNQTNNTGLFTNLAANTYTILATDANGCTISTTLTITEPTLLSITNITFTDPTCVPGNDGSMTITASGGTLPYTYNIGGANQANNVFANLGAGNYTITVTDANGCTATSTQTIAPPNSPTITAVLTTDVDCNGGNNGSITVTATGGLGALSYNLQPVNQNNATGIFTNLAAGVYTMTVADANGCTISSTATIIEPTILSWTTTATTDVNCNGGNDGTLTATATGGTGMINYNLQPTNQTNNTGLFTNLTAGTYTVTATDANGCTLTTTLVINQSPALTWTQNTATNITCNGGIDGSITTTATGGTGIINYNLQPTNQTNNTGLFTNLAANTYTILATDANGCTISTTLTITEPTLLSITNITFTNPTCVPGNDGSMTITASGGTLAYTYNIGGANQASNVFNSLGAGNYTITVTDANGCTATSTQIIAPPNSPTITAVVTTDVDCNGGNNGSITITATGGLGALNYNLQPVNQNNTTGIFTNLAASVYTMTVADANGCTISSTATIIEPTILSWSTTATTDVNCNGGNDGTLTATATGGTGIINYNLQPTNQTNNTGLFTNLTAGTYTVTATDANGCTLTTTLVINQSPALTWTQNTATNITCNGGIDGSITTTATGGTGIINYNLQPTNQTNNTGLFTNLAANTYTILATDANGCTISTTLTITEPTLLSITNITTTNPTCVPGNDGSMTITASGGTLAYTYNIGGANQANNVFANLGAGNYTITVTDANGCTATSTQTIAPPNSPTITAVVTTDVACNGGNNGSITVTATGGLGALNYTLQPVNQNNATGIFTNLTAGVYTMTVADANGCTISSTATIIEPTILSWTATAITDVNCNGGNDGTLTATATGGTGIINYNLQPTNQTNNTGLFTNLTAGTYTVTATDANGCTLTTTIVINQSPALTWTQNTATNITCNGGIDGSITTTATGGTGIINYNLQPTNQTNNTGLFTNLAANTYTILATDANGCTISTTLAITEPTLLSITNITFTDPTCVPGNDGSMTITASGGTLAYTYNIGGANQASNVFANLGAGNYTITVTDANGCTATSTQTIAPPNSPTITAVVTTDVDCNGGNNGSITVTATGGLGALSYTLQPVNQNNATGIFTNLAAGVYTMTVADANGCTISSTATIIEPTILSWTATATTDVNCNGGNDGTLTATATGGTGMINYNLQPTNQTNNTGLFTNLTAGTYTVTATDANGCTLTTTLVINQSPALTWTQNTATNITCNGGNDGTITTTATGGTGIINYNLQPTNQTNNTGLFTNLAANTYTILATDANGCTISTTLTITEPTLLSITNITFTNPTCVPGNDGSMTITASGGTLAYTYNIGGANQASNVFNSLGAGNYTITVTDANGCTATSTQTIAPPNSPTITAVVTTDVACNGGNNGSITVTATGGLGALNYTLQPVNQNNATGIFTNLTAGVYTMTVADANGCTISSTATIIEPTILSWTATAITDVNCNGGNDGTLTATATGGTGMINYNLQPTNQTNNTGLFTNLTAGTYTVTATDANGCTLTTTLVINQSPALTWTQNTATDITCNGGIDGSITTTATGGTGIINYNLQPTNQTNNTGLFTNLAANIYTILATDANGCTISTTLAITEPTLLSITNITNTNPTCVPGNDGSMTITASGGTLAYTYNIGGANQASNVFANLGAGNYTITVTDANGCTATSAQTIAPPNSPTITAVVTTDVDCNGGNNGSITVTATGGLGALNYNLQPVNQNNATGIFTNLAAGVYTMTVADANGCTISSTATIIEPTILSWTSTATTDVNCNGGNDGTLTATATGGTGIINYNLQPTNQTNNTGLFTNLTAGTYTVTATDANGCTLTTTLVINQSPALTWTQNTATNITCNGGIDGSITTTATGGTGIINYNLQPTNQTNNTGLFTNLAANTYTILATDANGCTISTTLTITEPTLLSITNITNTNPTCVPGNDGSMTITASGGTLAYTYNIGGANQANNVFANLGAGNYTITVTDANGCTATSTQTIAPPNSPTITAVVTTDVDCNGGNNGSITVTATGGLGALNYNLQPVNQNNATGIFTNLAAGVYTMTVADANGCSISSTATIIEPTILSWTTTATTDVNCNGGNDGTLTATATGGTGMINYNLQPTNQTNNTGLFTNLTAGTYTVTATDANGCTLTTTLVINQSPALTWTQNTATNITCNGGIDGSITTTATGGTGTINYNLQPTNQTNNTGLFTNLAANIYTILATDANGCTISTTLTITEPTLLSITNITNTNPTCVPGNDGSMTITASGGTLAYTYNIGGANQASNVFNNLGAGNYTITVTDANGCTATSAQTIAPPNSPTITAVVTTDVDCNGGNNGSITVTATGGLGALNYNLQPVNQNNATGIFTNLAAGVYTMTVADANGCTISSTATIIEPTILSWTSTATTDVNCNGGNDGTLTATATGGTGIINYNLQPTNQTNNTGLFTNLTAGTYTVTATDANGCTLTTTLVINQSPALTWTQNTATNITCNGGIDGSITTTATGGTGIINYNLQPTNQTNNTGLFTNLAANTYTILATDANGCTISTTLTITEPTLLSITNITNTNPTCVPGNDGSMTITASGGTLAYTYNIGGANQANNVFANLGAGNYTITVTDANGCTATSTQTIAPPNSPTITAVVTTDLACNGGNNGSITVTATGGLGALNYNLQPVNQNNATGIFTNLAAGVYTMTVADANGCTISSTATIIEPTILSWTTTATTDVNCNGGNDGTLTATATGGTGMINYNLQPTNQTNNTGLFTNLTAGTYTVTATDANGCTLTTTLVINQSPALTWTQNTATNITCNGGIDGSITTTATGGTGIINYNLQPTNQTNNTGLFTNLAANTYTILATDANGCTISTTLTITEPTLLSITNITTTNPTCVPGNDGSMTITASGGTLAYTYNIGGANQANNVFANLGAGNYTITVTDANGCTATSVQTITTPNAPTITSALTTDANCVPGNNGTVSITANGGNGIYTYSADGINYQANNVITGLAAGTYTITVQDANGCTSSSLITINTTPSPVITNIAVTDATCVPGCDGTATITATGGNGIYTYSIDNINFQANNLFTSVCANVYTATVTDGNGCSVTSTFTVTSANAPTIALNNTVDVLCFGGNNGAIAVTANGAGPMTYLLLPNGITNATGLYNNLTAFTYTVQVTDANGCSASTIVLINEPPMLQFTNILNNGALCSGANNGSIDVSTTGGTGNITYGINPFANFVPPTIFNNLMGNTTYTVTATDANGCSVTSSIFISQPQPIVFTNTVVTDVLCINGNDGSISVQATGGTGILNYDLNPNPQNNITGIFNNLTAATYTVTVTDANNCTLTTALIVAEPTAISINTLTYTDITCSNVNDGTINVNAVGGIGVLTYNIQPLNITNVTGVFNALVANNYTIQITDANGCSIDTTVTIINPLPLMIDSLTSSNVLCNGDSNGNIQINVSGGTGLLNYNLLPQNINNGNGLFNNLPFNNYTITVTDANLCSISTIVMITEPLPLTATVLNIQNILCSGGNNGQIDIGANGGTTPYLFTILPLNINNGTGIFAGLTAGTYTVNVTDSNQCSTSIQPIVITEPTPVKFDIVTKEDVKCFGDSTGTITVTASGGTGVIVYDIQPNMGLQNPLGNFTLLQAGTYTIIATDANNCTVSTTVVLLQNNKIVFDEITFVSPKCWGESNGIIQLTASGGVGQLTYYLNNQNPNTNGFFNQLLGGNYVATVMDALGCTIDSNIVLTQPERLAFEKLQIDPVYCKGYSNGKIISIATGGHGGYTYYLRPGLQVNKTGIFTGLHEGVYSLSIKDSMGCEFDTIIAVSPPLFPMDIIISKKDLSCYGKGTEGWALANVIGGEAPYTYLWNTSPAQYDEKAINLFYGYYVVEVTDARGCKEIDSVYIEPGPCCEEVFVPNAFSPNGDGNNDIFRVTTSSGIELIQFEVFDRWGKRIWSTNDFRSGWDGNDRGEACDMNTYYYIFRYTCLTDGENYIKKGDINLIR